jgi:phospholipid:diacylglycerol acyltransferase
MASTLRRRAIGVDAGSESTSPTSTSRDESPVKPGDKVKIIHHTQKQPTRKRKNTFIFLLGGLFGIVLAGFLAKSNDLIEFPEIGELSMDSIMDVLPAGLVKDMRDLIVRCYSPPYLQLQSCFC